MIQISESDKRDAVAMELRDSMTKLGINPDEMHGAETTAEVLAEIALRALAKLHTAPVSLGTGDHALTPANQCRKLGVKVGDVIVGREINGVGLWHEAELRLIWIGDNAAVFLERHRTDRNPRWSNAVEAVNWTLSCREWWRISR